MDSAERNTWLRKVIARAAIDELGVKIPKPLRQLEQCIKFLAGYCDGAYTIDGVGFNKIDANFGHWLVNRIDSEEDLLRSYAEAALRMLQKYKKQLQRAGLHLPEWEDIRDLYPENKSSTSESHLQYRVQIIQNEVVVYSPYDRTGNFQKLAKSIQGYRFCGDDKSWRFPLINIEQVLQKLVDHKFDIAPEVEGARILAKQIRAEEEEIKNAELLKTAEGIVQLVQVADLDKPLSNGWYLRDYQKKGVEWLLAHRRGGIYQGGILADHMGLGKSLTALIASRAMQRSHDCPIFVICPVSVMDNWVREAERAEVAIEVFSWVKLPQPLESTEYVLIADEAHYIQNLQSVRTKKLLELAQHQNCLAVWLLTGTPIKNGRPVNLFPLLLACGHPVANDKWGYERRYCAGHQTTIRGKSIWDNTGASHLKELSEKTEDVILRRTKNECLKELPDKTRLYKEVELEASTYKEYKEIISLYAEDYRRRSQSHKFKGNLQLLFKCQSLESLLKWVSISDSISGDRRSINLSILWVIWVLTYNPCNPDSEALVTLNTLRKIGSQFKAGAAIQEAESLLEQNEQVVLFTEFVESAQTIAKNFDALLLTGDTDKQERQQLVDKFQAGENKVFVCTIKAGGVGLTLTAASNVILVDRPWTPGDAEQGEDRCHRLGQKNAVFATWLQIGEVDKAIDSLLLQKQERIEFVLKGKWKTLQGITSANDLAKELMNIL